MNETFGQWLTRSRKAVGLNQTELAERARVSKATISLYEKDEIDQPRRHQVEKLAKALNVSIDEAREKAYATRPDATSTSITITDDIRLVLNRRDVSPEDREEFDRAVKLAVAMAEDRIAEKNKQKAS